ncbi:MAG: ATP-binding protein [Sulfurovum sp.]|nr:ATP-binding protein [Sulfurovum sp.]MDD3602372.1 ATP-binding protein [Sulfurovum sp.]
MAITAIPVDQRVIDIDSRRFASIEKALVELITNSDDSYARLEKTGSQTTGQILIKYERHQTGALLTVTDQAEGMSFEKACFILSYGGAHSALAKGESGGRGYFGRGLKQAIYGLGHGWMETIHEGRVSRIELFRSENGGYLYDDGAGSRPAASEDYERLGILENGTQITIVIENAQVNISRFQSVVQSIANNIYLRDILTRRHVEMINMQQNKEAEKSGKICYQEPPANILIGPDQTGYFVHEQQSYPFTLTLKRAMDTELSSKGDERTNGLIVISDMAVLDCQLFEYENQIGTEYLFGTVNCPALIEKLSQGIAIISDEREGLNRKDPFVIAFSKAVSGMIAPCVNAEQEKLKHLEHASTSERTDHMIEHLLERMNMAAVQDFGIVLALSEGETDINDAPDPASALRFTTPFYYRKQNRPFHIALLIDSKQFAEDEVLECEYILPPSIEIEPMPLTISPAQFQEKERIEWSVLGEKSEEHGEIIVRGKKYWAQCEIVIADQASQHEHYHGSSASAPRKKIPRDHGANMFVGYELRNLNNDRDRAVYSHKERKIIINTGAPTVQLYIDGRGHFRDSARLLLAELFMDVISDELAGFLLKKSGIENDAQAYHTAKNDIIRRYGSEIHLSFLNT